MIDYFTVKLHILIILGCLSLVMAGIGGAGW